MDELRQTLLQARADVQSGIDNAAFFTDAAQTAKELSRALAAINRAIADLEAQSK